MRNRKISIVVALVLTLVLVVSPVAYAVPGDVISNTLNATFNVTGTTQTDKLTVSARTRDAGLTSETDKGGYSVELTFTDGTVMSNLTNLEVNLFRGDNKLVTNTMLFDNINDSTKLSSKVSVPFNIGTEGNNEWAWDRGAFPVVGPLDDTEVPNKVVVNFEKGGVQYTFTQVVTLRLPIQQAKALAVTASTRDASPTPETDKGGYGIELAFSDSTVMDDLDELEVNLYRDNIKLVTNSMLFDNINDSTKLSSKVSVPFNIGTEGNNQWAWDRGAFPITEPLDDSEVPNKVVVNYEKAGVQYTFTQNVILTLPKQVEKEPVSLIWDLSGEPINATVGEKQTAIITATLGESQLNAYLIVEVKDDSGIAVGDVVLNIGTGQLSTDSKTLTFTSTNMTIDSENNTIELEITFKVVGNYNINAYLIEGDAF